MRLRLALRPDNPVHTSGVSIFAFLGIYFRAAGLGKRERRPASGDRNADARQTERAQKSRPKMELTWRIKVGKKLSSRSAIKNFRQ
jgi:hypothetical protein